MKRGAEMQLTKDNVEEEDVEELSQTQAFKKADENALAKRPMKGLPKRSMALNAPSPFSVSEKPEPTTGPAASKNLGSAAPAPTASFAAPASGSPLAISASTSQPSESPFKFGAGPLVSSSATTAAKQFGSILEPATIPNGINGTSDASAMKPATKDENETIENYYKSLRGLNKSFRDAITGAIESDPFVDLSELATHYKSIRTSIQKDVDSTTAHPQSLTNGSGVGVEDRVAQSKSSVSSITPTPPMSFAFENSRPSQSFAQTKSSSSTTPTSPGSFAFKFPRPSQSESSVAQENKADSCKPIALSTASSFTFGTPPSTSSDTASEKEKPAVPSSFSFGAPSTTTTSTSLFGAPPAKPSPFGTTTPASSSPFGTSGTLSSPFSFSADKGKEVSTTKPETHTGLLNPFAPSASTTSTSSPLFGSQSMPASSSPFGKPPSLKGNIGNPVGFSFGAPKSEGEKGTVSETERTDSKTTTSTATTSSEGFSFKPSTSVIAAEARPGTPGSIDGDTTDGDAVTPSPLGENPHDLEGEGEEDEETLHSIKVKIYRFGKKDNEFRWFEVGLGFLRVKKHKETSARRLLSRNSASGRIMMNSMLYPGLKITQTKQLLNLVLHDEKGESITYRIRTKDEPSAKELKEVVEKEISAL